MIETLLVSKPIAPPWNDSGKNLVRDLAAHCTTVRLHVLTVPGFSLGLPHVVEEAIYRRPGRFAPGWAQNARALARLLRPDGVGIYHFFYAPNPRTSRAARSVLAMKRRRTVQTVMSVPRAWAGVRDLVFADRVVALSESTRDALAAAGVESVVHIPPAVDLAACPVTLDRDGVASRLRVEPGRPIVAFPGDYEFSSAAQVFAEAVPSILRDTDAVAVFACRAKRAASRGIEDSLRARFADAERAGRVRFTGEIDFVRDLLAAAAVVTLPAESTYAKMDLPLVLLEALGLGTPVVVADVAPLREVLGTPSARPRRPVGLAVPPRDPGALARAVVDLVRGDEERRAMGAAARAWVADRFGAPAMGAAHARLYAELADD